MIQVTTTLKRLIKRSTFPFIFILLIQLSSLTMQGQQVILCYPQSAVYWTGSCSSTLKEEASLVKWKSDNSLRGWFMFDISSIPISATIDSVKLIYYCNQAAGTINTQITPFLVGFNPSLPANTAGIIYSAIGTATPYVTTATALATDEQVHWRTIVLGSPTMNQARLDVKNSIGSGHFAVGAKTSTTGTTPYRYVSGWNQPGFIPYLRVVYTPSISNDAGIDSITSPKNLYCAGVYPIVVKLRNAGDNNITSLKINWQVIGMTQPQITWTGTLLPGATTYDTLDPAYNFSGGNFNIIAATSLPNGVADQSTSNDSRTAFGQILYQPSVNSQPTDMNTSVGGTVVFSTQGKPIGGVNYQWQLSTDGGATFSSLTNTAPYSNVTTKDLTVTSVTPAMNGYEFRCNISGVCLPAVTTDTVSLSVGPPVNVTLGNGYACPPDTLVIPCNVTNMNSVLEIKLTMNYNPASLTTPTYLNLNPALLTGTVTLTESPAGHLVFHWTGPSATIVSGKICDFSFSYLSGNSTIIFDTITSGASLFAGVGGIHFPTDYHNGNAFSNIAIFLTGGTDPPTSTVTDIGGSAMFNAIVSGAPVLTWQSSPKPYTTWTNLTNGIQGNGSVYSGVNTNTLSITNCAQTMDSLKFHCKAVACGATTYSNAALLRVILKVRIWLDTIHACHGDYITFSCRVRNWINVFSFSGIYEFKPTALTYIPNPYVSYLFGFPWVPYASINLAYPAWWEYRTAWITTNTLDPNSLPNESVLFTMKYHFVSDSSILQWDTWHPGNCEISDFDGNSLSTVFQNGYALDAAPHVTANPPLTVSMAAGDTTNISCTANGWQGVTFVWQYSTDGITFFDVPLGVIYAVTSNATTSTLHIQGPSQALNNYKYRCKVTGLCTPVTSTVTILTVTPPPAKFIAPVVITCLGDTIFANIKVTDFTSISAYNLKIRFDSTQMTYNSSKNRNPLLTPAGFIITNPTSGTILMSWTKATAVTLPGTATMFTLKFVSLNLFSNSPLTFYPRLNPTTYIPATTLIPKYTNGSVTTSALPDPHNVTTPLPAGGHFCAGGTGVLIGMDYMNTGVNYSLYNPALVITVAGTGQPQYFGTFNTPGTYTVIASNQVGSCPRAMDGQVVVVADPLPSVYNVTATGGGSYCQGGPGVTIGLANSQIGVLYVLSRVGVKIDSIAGTGAALNFPVPQTIAGVYNVIAKNNITKTCLVPMYNTVTVVMNQQPNITAMVTAPCSGVAFTVAPVNGTNGTVPVSTTYSWSTPTGAGFTGGASGSALANISNTLTNTTNAVVTASYSVTPTAGTCPGTPFTITATVNPKPNITAMTATPCSGAAFTLSPANGTNGIVPATTTYSWAAPAGIGFTGGAIGTAASNISGTITNTTNAAVTAIYTVTPSTGSCTGSTFTITVTVKPKPNINAMTASPCSGIAFTSTPANITNGVVPAATTYSWGFPTGTGFTGGAAGSAASNISGTLVNTTNTPSTATYVVTPTSGTCAGSTFNLVVTTNPKPVIIPQTTSVCSGNAFTVTPANGGGNIVPAGTTYSWGLPSGTGFTGGVAGNSALNISGTLINPTINPIAVTYSVTPTSGSCPGSTFTVIVTLNPFPTILLLTPNSICQDTTPFTLNGTPSGGTYTGSPGITNASTGAFNPALVSGNQTITYSLTQAGCTGSSIVTFNVITKYKISGTVHYDLPTGTPLGNILITRKVLATNVTIDNVTSASSGSYDFRCVNPGTYKLVPSTTRPWGNGANTLDALLAQKYSVGIITLSNIRKKAADVNLSGSVSALDALLISKRFVGTVSSFAAGDWVYELSDTVPVTTANVSREILALKTGDVNGSDIQIPKLAPGIRLRQSGVIAGESLKTFEIPFSPDQKLSLGAMSIVINYNPDYLEIINIKSTLDNLEYFIDRGEIRIGWYSLTPANFNPGDVMFVIRGRVNKETPEKTLIGFEAGIECELADEDANILDTPILIYPALITAPSQSTFIVPDEHEYYLGNNFPNPFTQITEIPYYLPEASNVRLSVINLLGEEISLLYEGKQIQGVYNLSFDGSKLLPGIYLYRLTANGNNRTFDKSRTLIINR